MSITYEEAAYDDYMGKLIEEANKEAIEEFTLERLQSYYIDHKELADSATKTLSEARSILPLNITAGFIFASIAIEVGLKTLLLKPIVYGLVNTESIADLITDLTMAQTSMNRYQKLLFQILEEHGNMDLNCITRNDSKKKLWEEINEVQKKRNAIKHGAETATKEEAELAIDVAAEILEKLFPAVISKLGLHLHNGFRICNEKKCKSENITYIAEIQEIASDS